MRKRHRRAFQQLEARRLLAGDLAPSFADSFFNDGDPAPSIIREITFQTDEPVGIHSNASPFKLHHVDTATDIALSHAFFGGDTFELTFDNVAVLPSGQYRLTVDASDIFDSDNNTLDGSGDGVGGDNYVHDFHVLRGDGDGDGVVTLADFGRFRGAFGSSEGDSNYNLQYDLDGDGTTGLADFGAFRGVWGETTGPIIVAEGETVSATYDANISIDIFDLNPALSSGAVVTHLDGMPVLFDMPIRLPDGVATVSSDGVISFVAGFFSKSDFMFSYSIAENGAIATGILEVDVAEVPPATVTVTSDPVARTVTLQRTGGYANEPVVVNYAVGGNAELHEFDTNAVSDKVYLFPAGDASSVEFSFDELHVGLPNTQERDATVTIEILADEAYTLVGDTQFSYDITIPAGHHHHHPAASNSGPTIVQVKENKPGEYVAQTGYRKLVLLQNLGMHYEFKVDDDRFLVDKSGVIWLKPHTFLDFETEQEIDITFTASPYAGQEFSHFEGFTFTLDYKIQVQDFFNPGTPNIVIQANAFIPKDKGTNFDWSDGYNPAPQYNWIYEQLSFGTAPEGTYYFSTDDRSKAGEIGTSRIAAAVVFEPTALGNFQIIQPTFGGGSDASHRVDVLPGANVAVASSLVQDTEDPTITTSWDDSVIFGSGISVTASGGYPLAPLNAAPHIDYTAEFEITHVNGGLKIDWNIKHNKFPAYEIIVNGEVAFEYRPRDDYPTGPLMVTSFRSAGTHQYEYPVYD